MYKNYFYLFRAIAELRKILLGKSIREIYTQEKEKVFLSMPMREREDFHLIISTEPQFPYLIYKSDHRKARKNTKNFFGAALPAAITELEIASDDRLIRISLDNGAFIYFVIRGARTNLVFLGADKSVSFFKKTDPENFPFLFETPGKINFINGPEALKAQFEGLSRDEIISKFKFVDVKIRSEIDSQTGEFAQLLQSITDQFLNDKIRIFQNELTGEFHMQPSSFGIPTGAVNILEYDSYNDAVTKFISLRFSDSDKRNLMNEVENYLSKEIERVAAKLNNVKIRIEKGSRENEYMNYGNLILSNIHSLSKGMKEAKLNNPVTNEPVLISLDAKLTPAQNADRYFEKGKGEKISFSKSKELFRSLSERYNFLIEKLKQLEAAASKSDVLAIKQALKMKDNTLTKEEKGLENFRHYVIEGKYHVYVGKDSKNNDLLTTRYARQNDLWFHARSVSGSHVVLRLQNQKESIPKPVIKKAASIAAFYSKAKTSKLASVSYTQKKYVVKKKNLDAGQVILLKEEVLLVTPEIPKDCEPVAEE